MKKIAPYLFSFTIGIIASISFVYFYRFHPRYYTLRVYNKDYSFCSTTVVADQKIKYLEKSIVLPVGLSSKKLDAILDSLNREFPQKEKLIELVKSTDDANNSSLHLPKEIISKKDVLYFEKVDTSKNHSFTRISVVR